MFFYSQTINTIINHQTTVPYNPQSSGKAERLNGVLIATATALLEDSKLSRKFWQDAVSTASYVYNRIPHRSIRNNIPYEILFNKKVDFSNIRVFGCKVVFLIPKQLKQKFDNNASSGIFLGYCQEPNPYKIFDTNRNKIIRARTVEFIEEEPENFYFNNQISDINKSYNINEFSKLPLPIYYKLPSMHQPFNNKEATDHNDIINSDILKLEESFKNVNHNTVHNINYSLNNKRKYHPDQSLQRPHYINEIKRYNKLKIEDFPNNKKVKIFSSNNRKLPVFIEPSCFNEIFLLPDKDEWLQAINEERNNLKKLGVYDPADNVPNNANIVFCCWIFKYKRNAQGEIIKRKAHLVTGGFTQQIGMDYFDTYSPTLKQDSLRIIIAIASQNRFQIKQIDINSAYLNADLKEDIYVKAPEGFNNTT